MRTIAVGVLLALVVTACGDATEPESPTAPSPVVTGPGAPTTVSEPDETAPITSEADESAAAGPRELTFTTSDGLVLEGTAFGDGPDWVVLAHMRPADMSSWFPFARLLAGEGYSALAFNFRGYGNSEGDGFDVESDVIAAIDFALDQGAERLFVMGASMGGTGSLAASARRDVAGVVTLSAPAAFEGTDGLGAVPNIVAPKLFIAGDGDADYADIANTLADAAAEPKEVAIYASGEHGTNLFESNGDELTALLFEFLAGS